MNFCNRYLQLPSHFYSRVNAEPLHDAVLLHANQPLLASLNIGLEQEALRQMSSGQTLPPGLSSLAQKYTGHQFGYYNPDLGDGRGLLLGQAIDAQQRPWDLHLKGAGQTPYSRRGDGRAVLRSAIREYLGGEALHALGIPSTRCLTLCHNREAVRRETYEPRAAYIRVAKTHVRFGHFEWLAERNDKLGMQQLADYVIDTVYPELRALDPQERYAELLHTVIRNTADLIAGWQSVGFCHGVLNTDNMSVAAETFDFGPYAFMDDFKIHHICNHSDTEGRYAYSQQPNIGLWNCQVFAQAFALILDEDKRDAVLADAINGYVETYNQRYLDKMRAKIGVQKPQPHDRELVADLLILMDQSDIDFQQFFLELASLETQQAGSWHPLAPESKAWRLWFERYRLRCQLEQDPSQIAQTILQNTPRFVLRNYINQEVIEAAENGDFSLFSQVFEALRTPHEKHPALPQRYYQAPQLASQKGIALSCSS